MSTPAFRHAALRAHARGIYPDEAGTELLNSHGSFLARSDFRDRFLHPATSITDGTTTIASLDWPAATNAVTTGHLPRSDGERQILQIAASLTHGIHVDPRDALTGLDHHIIQLVATPVRHASGQRPRFLDHS